MALRLFAKFAGETLSEQEFNQILEEGVQDLNAQQHNHKHSQQATPELEPAPQPTMMTGDPTFGLLQTHSTTWTKEERQNLKQQLKDGQLTEIEFDAVTFRHGPNANHVRFREEDLPGIRYIIRQPTVSAQPRHQRHWRQRRNHHGQLSSQRRIPPTYQAIHRQRHERFSRRCDRPL